MLKKLYCYVDETGQDTKGKLFIISVVVTGSERDELIRACEKFEDKSGKGRVKWRKSSYESRLEYLSLIIADKRFKKTLRYEIFRGTKLYDAATIEGIVDAINWRKPSNKFTTLIYIDGLAKTKRHDYGAMLRHLGLPTRKVQGIRKDENNALIRLADAVSGFIRDVVDDQTGKLAELFLQAKEANVLIEVCPKKTTHKGVDEPILKY